MPSLKAPTIAGTLAWGGVLLGFWGSLLFGSAADSCPAAGEPRRFGGGPRRVRERAFAPASRWSRRIGSASGCDVCGPGRIRGTGRIGATTLHVPGSVEPAPGRASAPFRAARSPPRRLPVPYVYEPPPPAPPMHRSPWNSLFLGARVGALFPFGNAYATDRDYYYEYGEEWAGLATGGPLVEADVGARFARSFIVYGFWEHAWMGKGSDPSWRAPRPPDTNPNFGNQTSATTDYPGLGFRWSSRPSTVGVLIDVGLGYRWFQRAMELRREDGPCRLRGVRLGLGADIRLSRLMSLTPLLSISSGAFSDRTVTLPGEGKQDIQGTYSGSHGTVTMTHRRQLRSARRGWQLITPVRQRDTMRSASRIRSSLSLVKMGQSARTATARWLMAFFSASLSSAIVLPAPGTMKSGS